MFRIIRYFVIELFAITRLQDAFIKRRECIIIIIY